MMESLPADSQPRQDKSVLIQLRDATNLAELSRRLGMRWDDGDLPLRHWDGVEVDSAGRAVSLCLTHNHLEVALVWNAPPDARHTVGCECRWEVERYLPAALLCAQSEFISRHRTHLGFADRCQSRYMCRDNISFRWGSEGVCQPIRCCFRCVVVRTVVRWLQQRRKVLSGKRAHK